MKYQKVAGGWITAEYAMLPYSTLDRKARDSSRGKLDGRSVEIQRLIGRSLRAVIDLDALGARTLWIDCDVLQADGGTRTASITGACVAAVAGMPAVQAKGLIKKSPIRKLVAAVSVGVVAGEALLDLNYVEDKAATVDMNLVMTEDGNFVELQGAGEERPSPTRNWRLCWRWGKRASPTCSPHSARCCQAPAYSSLGFSPDEDADNTALRSFG